MMIMELGILTAGAFACVGTKCINDLKDYIMEIRNDRFSLELSDHELQIGYNCNNRMKQPIVINMQENPHLLVAGLSQQGKTKLVEYALHDKQCILLNTYDDDYITVNPIARLNDINEIEKLLRYLCEHMQGNKQPLYIVIDEILALTFCSKDVSKSLSMLLAQAAHNSIYVICITQSAEKEVIKFKNLFNSRICFRMIDDINYKTCLGYMPEDELMKRRQFYYVSGELKGIGMTYDV